MICPCKGCVPPDRNKDCHTYCEKYTEWKKESDKIRDNRRKDRDIINALDSIHRHT